jgi:hypothetical protein
MTIQREDFIAATGNKVLGRLEKAGYSKDEASAIIRSKRNALAKTLVEVARAYQLDPEILQIIKEVVSPFVAARQSEEMRRAMNAARFWKKTFRGLNDSHLPQLLVSTPLPEWAVGYLVCPKPTAIGSGYKSSLSFIHHWRLARTKVLELLARRGITNYADSEVNGLNRLIERTQHLLERLCEETPGDFLLLPYQENTRHKKTYKDALVKFEEHEFFPCSYLMACHVAVRPDPSMAERVFGKLYLNCLGEEWSSVQEPEKFTFMPEFIYSDENERFLLSLKRIDENVISPYVGMVTCLASFL